MPEFPIRKILVAVEDVFHDGGPSVEIPRRRGSALALVKNPFAGRYAPELQSAMEDLKPLGSLLTERLIAAFGDQAESIDAYGKGAIVGTAGEIEHGALWHVPGGYAMRDRISPSKAIVPSAMKVGGFGASLDVPLGHVNAAYVRSHFDGMRLRISDAPRPGEIVVAVALQRTGRPLPRVGGLTHDEIEGADGLR